MGTVSTYLRAGAIIAGCGARIGWGFCKAHPIVALGGATLFGIPQKIFSTAVGTPQKFIDLKQNTFDPAVQDKLLDFTDINNIKDDALLDLPHDEQ